MKRTRSYTIKGDFYWDEANEIWQPSEFTKATKEQIEIVQHWLKPNASGVSDFVDVDELKIHYPKIAARLGGSGSDMFTRSVLSKNFILNDKDSIIKKGNKVTHRRSIGLVIKMPANPSIKTEIHKEIASMKCALTGTRTRVEVDHKEGRNRDYDQYKSENQSINDFQPLCAVGNLIKREACSKCVKTNERADARELGYTVGWTEGGSEYKGSCKGCFWHDIKAFRSSLKHSRK